MSSYYYLLLFLGTTKTRSAVFSFETLLAWLMMTINEINQPND